MLYQLIPVYGDIGTQEIPRTSSDIFDVTTYDTGDITKVELKDPTSTALAATSEELKNTTTGRYLDWWKTAGTEQGAPFKPSVYQEAVSTGELSDFQYDPDKEEKKKKKKFGDLGSATPLSFEMPKFEMPKPDIATILGDMGIGAGVGGQGSYIELLKKELPGMYSQLQQQLNYQQQLASAAWRLQKSHRFQGLMV